MPPFPRREFADRLFIGLSARLQMGNVICDYTVL
jgi:hypothetical protein